VVVETGNGLVPLAWATQCRDWKPDWLEWGYGGSGPAQLAVAMLWDATEDRATVLRLSDDFMADVVARLPRAEFRLPVEDVREWVRAWEQRNGVPG
jgi:hypothetical protein